MPAFEMQSACAEPSVRVYILHTATPFTPAVGKINLAEVLVANFDHF